MGLHGHFLDELTEWRPANVHPPLIPLAGFGAGCECSRTVPNDGSSWVQTAHDGMDPVGSSRVRFCGSVSSRAQISCCFRLHVGFCAVQMGYAEVCSRVHAVVTTLVPGGGFCLTSRGAFKYAVARKSCKRRRRLENSR